MYCKHLPEHCTYMFEPLPDGDGYRACKHPQHWVPLGLANQFCIRCGSLVTLPFKKDKDKEK